MADNRPNLPALVSMMRKSPEHAQRGFQLLAQSKSAAAAFPAIREAGLLSADMNPAPTKPDGRGYYRVPFWAALDFLEACAKASGELSDEVLARGVLDILTSVSTQMAVEENRDNYRTRCKFAEIAGQLPLTVVVPEIAFLAGLWLSPRFQRDMVVTELSRGVVRRLLADGQSASVDCACQLLEKIVRVAEIGEDVSESGPSSMDEHATSEFLSKRIPSFAKLAPARSAAILRGRVEALFAQGSQAKWSWLIRPAVEDHEQNHSWKRGANALVEALRLVLNEWVVAAPAGAREFVEESLDNGGEMIKRVAVHTVNERWSDLCEVLSTERMTRLLRLSGLLHEMHRLLATRFSEMSDLQRAAVLGWISSTTAPDGDPYGTAIMQAGWLTLVSRQGSAEADALLAELRERFQLPTYSERDSFHAYSESWNGPGPSPYQSDELVAFALDGTIVEKLNEFLPTRDWRSPSKRALVDALEAAIRTRASVFAKLAPRFIDADRSYQYGFISGFRSLWQKDESAEDPDWPWMWAALLSLIESLVVEDELWAEAEVQDPDMTPSGKWIPTEVGRALRAGTQDDAHAYPPELLPRAWGILQVLLERSNGLEEPGDEPLTAAINNERGVAIEAAFSHLLRACRLEDAQAETHSATARQAADFLASEVARLDTGNFEFSALAGAMFAHLEYLNSEWLDANQKEIFSTTREKHLFCALDGLSYSRASKSTYERLQLTGVLPMALKPGFLKEQVRDRILERVALAFLWGLEELEGPIISSWFDSRDLTALQTVADFLWSLREQKLTDVHRTRIGNYLVSVSEWAAPLLPASEALLSSLSRLIVYVDKIDSQSWKALLHTAKYIHVNYNSDTFLEGLLHHVDGAPQAVAQLLASAMGEKADFYDYEDKVKTLVRRIARAGEVVEALRIAEELRSIPGMLAVYKEIAGQRS